MGAGFHSRRARADRRSHFTSNPALNPTALENQRAGSTDWPLNHPATQREIEGYASLTSVNRGGTIQLFVNTVDAGYAIDIFRMGWYDGAGARRVMESIQREGIRQPDPIIEPLSGMIECAWREPFVLQVPEDWVSGVYLAKLTASRGKQSYIIFVVRDDYRTSKFLFQSSVTTYQAYNNWGGKSLYEWNSKGRQASRVSFNRPYAISPNPAAAYGVGAGEFLTNVQPARRTSSSGWEYSMVRWLEKEGYDVTYATSIDTHKSDRMLRTRSVFLSVGHDEYWSWSMRQNVESARDAGVSLGFFSANTCYWQIRFESSSITGDVYRTIVAYKENAALDPLALDGLNSKYQVTTRWRQVPVSLPESSLIGVMYQTDPVLGDIVISPSAPDWVLGNTGLEPGASLPGLLGYEVDRITSDSPAGIVMIAHSPYLHKRRIRYADMTIYQSASKAKVFATGSIQWSWGLDDYNVPTLRPSYQSEAAQQITRNILAHLSQHP